MVAARWSTLAPVHGITVNGKSSVTSGGSELSSRPPTLMSGMSPCTLAPASTERILTVSDSSAAAVVGVAADPGVEGSASLGAEGDAAPGTGDVTIAPGPGDATAGTLASSGVV